MALVLLAAVLLAASLRGWAWAALFPLALAAASVALAVTPRPPALSRPVLLVGALWGASLALSLAPAPASWIAVLSPGAVEVAGFPLAESLPRRLHQAPGEGFLAVLQWATAVLMAVAVALRVDSSSGRSRLRGAVVAVGLVASVVCILWTATGGEGSFGLHPMETWEDRWLPPMDNPNHWSAWLTMVAAVALALPLDERRREGLAMAALPVGVLALGLIGTGSSRGGLLGLSVVVLLLAMRLAWVGPGRLERIGRRTRVSAVLVSAVAASGALVWALRARTHGMVHGVTQEYVGGFANEGRIQFLPDALEVLASHRWTGVGRGGVNDVLLRYQDVPGTRLRRFIEVLPVDLVLAHGVVIGGALVLLLAGCVLLALRRSWRLSGSVGAAAGFAGLAVHELGDYSTWGGGVLLMAVALAVLSLRVGDPRWSRARWAAVLAVAAAAGLFSLGPAVQHDDSRYCFERLQQERGGLEALDAFAADELRMHPASGALAFEIGVAYFELGQAQSSLTWLNRAQLLAPRHPEPHLWTARLLHGAGFESQAINEYRLAAAGDWLGRAQGVVLEVAGLDDSTQSLERLIPPDRPHAVAEIALWLDGAKDPRMPHFGALALERFPDRADARLAGATAALAEGSSHQAVILVNGLWDTEGLTPSLRLRMAKILDRAGRGEDALTRLRHAQTLAPDYGPEPWLVLGTWEARAGEIGRARAALRKVRRFSHDRLSAKSLVQEAWIEKDAGRLASAIDLLDRAAAQDPTWAESLVLKARVEAEAGDIEGARRSLGHALGRQPGYVKAMRSLAALDP